MRIAVTGAGGGLGSALLAGGSGRHELVGLTHRELDVRDDG